MGKSLVSQSIVHDMNENFFDTNSLENHIDLKIKPPKDANTKNNSLWNFIYNFEFIIPFL